MGYWKVLDFSVSERVGTHCLLYRVGQKSEPQMLYM